MRPLEYEKKEQIIWPYDISCTYFNVFCQIQV